MRHGLLGTLGALLAGAGLTLAQPAPDFRPARSFSFGPDAHPVNRAPVRPTAAPVRAVHVEPAAKPAKPPVRPASATETVVADGPVQTWPADALAVSDFDHVVGPVTLGESYDEGPVDLGVVSEGCASCLCDGRRLWVSAEYLMWWLQDSPIPAPLVTSGPIEGLGVLGQPGTQVLIGNGGVDSGTRNGGRLSLGYWWCEQYAFEIGGFWIGQDGFTAVINPGNGALLARPFVDAGTGLESSLLVAGGATGGTVSVSEVNRLFGVEANAHAAILRNNGHHVNLLAGFRQVTFDDDLTIRGVSVFQPPVAIQSLTITDRFQTENRWYGGQVGVQGGINCGRLFLSSSTKFGFGVNQQRLSVAGQTLASNGNTAAGGLLALAGNSIDDSANELSFLNETVFDIGFRVTDNIVLSAGYSFLYLTGIVRPGEQIDRVANPALIPSQANFNPGAAPVRPEPRINQGDFWAHGLHVGLSFRY